MPVMSPHFGGSLQQRLDSPANNNRPPLLFGAADDHHGDDTSSSSSSSASSSSSHHFHRSNHRRGGSRGRGSRGISSFELRQMNQVRRQRFADEAARQARYVTGDDLHELRLEILQLHEDLHQARRNVDHDVSRVAELERTILQAQQLDAEFMYQVACQRMQAARLAGRLDQAFEYSQQAMDARLALPQFNLQGLWVGKYCEEHGSFEMINVTYVGDVLVARKVTGDRTVPKGEVSFSVDLSPSSSSSAASSVSSASSFTTSSSSSSLAPPQVPVVQPIELGPEAAQQWGTKYLQRFAGQGQVASEGYTDSEWLAGQLVLVGQDYFSFAWLPIGHQVFFGRPSPELTLKLLRESRQFEEESPSPETTTTTLSTAAAAADPTSTITARPPPPRPFEITDAREHLRRCMEETELIEEEMEANGGVFGPDHQLDYYSQEGCFE
jgi:Cyclin D1 binding domain